MTGTTTGIRRCSSTCCGRKCWRPEVCTRQRRRRTGTTPTCWRHPLNPTTPTSSAHFLGMYNGVSLTSSFACKTFNDTVKNISDLNVNGSFSYSSLTSWKPLSKFCLLVKPQKIIPYDSADSNHP